MSQSRHLNNFLCLKGKLLEGRCLCARGNPECALFSLRRSKRLTTSCICACDERFALTEAVAVEMSLNRKYSSAKDRGPTIVIPNIPKITDIRSRGKLMCEYEKYEAELFKHHLGPPDTTCTMSVKQAPTDFDRRVPGMDEPTAADLLHERRKTRGGARWGLEKRFGAPVFAAGGTGGNTSTKQQAAGRHGSVPYSAADGGNSRGALPAVPSVTPLDVSTNNPPNQQGTAGNNRDNTSTYSPLSIRAPEEDPEDVLSSSARRRGTKGQRVSLQVPRRPPQGADPTVKIEEAEGKEPLGRTQEGKSKGGRRFRSLPRRAPLRVQSPLFDTEFLAPGGCNWTVCTGQDYSSWNAEHCAEVLRVLLKPPPEYGESFKVDMSHTDLRWMWNGRMPKNFTSLQSWRVEEVKGRVVPVVNSPRSALVMLRCGITVPDLLVHEIGDDAPLLPTDPEDRTMVKSIRMKQHKASVISILEQVRNEYCSLCCAVSLPDLVEAFRRKRQVNIEVAKSAMIRDALEKQKRLFECAERKLEVEANRAKNLQERERLIELRNERLQEMMMEKVRRKREEDLIAQQNAAARIKLQQERNAEREKEYQRELQERLERAEERTARQQAARDHLLEQRRIRRKKNAEERQARIERMAEMQEQQSEILRRKYEERDAKVQLVQEERERKQREAQELLAARAAKSQELREQARQRALLREEEVRQAALGQQQEVENRLRQLTKQREEEVAERAKKEAEKRERLKGVLTLTAEKQISLKEVSLKKQEKFKERHDEIQRHQAEEIMLKRERERDLMEAKAFAVLQKKRVAEFNKVEVVLQLIAKREATEALETQREMLLRENFKNHATLTQHRKSLKEDIARKKSLQG
ncbi:hypothetical protein, conserved [Trypanosoma brucei brucei TREU927]|uniref:Uncharacterized protein n=2 Tax=Trypanozoon TaxID=39700 RepID=Q383R7_TRYB2|nr:hypothetical protein, conserved [Trypanosoma brucei brucei TREU927]EAN79964.1 hypothetical protein, conserved [Trypanosoma brucei brucei TREU927]